MDADKAKFVLDAEDLLSPVDTASSFLEAAEKLAAEHMPYESYPHNVATHLFQNRSLENILLDSSPMDESIDLGTDISAPVAGDQSIYIDVASLIADESTLVGDITSDINWVDINKTSEKNFTETSSDDYGITFDVDNAAVPDDMAGKHTMLSFPDSTFQYDTDAVEGKDDLPTVQEPADFSGQQSHSSGDVLAKDLLPHTQPDTVPVGFVEAKGPGLRPADSTRSLCRFFADGAGSTDAMASSFFDSFTADTRSELPESPQQSIPVVDHTSPMNVATGLHYRQDGGDFAISTTQEFAQSQPVHISQSTMPVSPLMPTVHSVIPGLPSPQPVLSGLVYQVPPGPAFTSTQQLVTESLSPQTALSGMIPPQPLLTTMISPVFGIPSSVSSDGAHEFSPTATATISILPGLVSATDTVDPFTACLVMSDMDRRTDAWIPSDQTRQTLVVALTAPPGTAIILPADQMTMPAVLLEESLGDPVREMVQRFMGDQEASRRLVLNADSVPQDLVGLDQLNKAECWRSAVDLTGRLLTQCGQGPGRIGQPCKHSTYSLQVWLYRISLLVKLRLYSQADIELAAFGAMDNPDLYFECNQDIHPLRRGSMVPFELRLLAAEVPLYVGRSQETLDRLYHLQAVVTKIISNLDAGLAEDGSMQELSESSRNVSRTLWQSRAIRVVYALGSCLLHIKDYGAAIDIYESLLSQDESHKVGLLCGIGRIFLQIGDIKQAEKCFADAETLSDPTASGSSGKCRHLLNRGLLALANSQFSEAYTLFSQVISADPTNVVAVNNMAVCALYLGRLKEALKTLEGVVFGNPGLGLHDSLLLNLCTLYELESSRAPQKKQHLLSLVNRHKGNGFNVTCLKMA